MTLTKAQIVKIFKIIFPGRQLPRMMASELILRMHQTFPLRVEFESMRLTTPNKAFNHEEIRDGKV